MSDNFLKIQLRYVREIYDKLFEDLEDYLPAIREGNTFHFNAFGQPCTITPEGIFLSGELLTGGLGIIIALYARYVSRDEVQLLPPKAFAQIKGSQPHQGAFRVRSEQSLVPHVGDIRKSMDRIVRAFDGFENKDGSGDFSFTLFPLPKVPLYYVFYCADEEFPASVTCLFAANAESFMPIDGLADVGEHTAEKIFELIT
ncbi:MAG: hypothetical protein DRG87_09050 [Deltaproteobacteria bacterium]|nr:DUF3786 domain-containing protein [Deltaproteobacteria bacterium]MBW2076437.1 DUF3786 domain-containing protein [Deltaproteobacteria bacterium]MBW2310045.1 DUF3786 domain-containing protein [Deltaproteobacteria bacterium]RLB28570.1 MAG: hypothetical protein DRG87_09050 [Deltaproteobacteria bacterium]